MLLLRDEHVVDEGGRPRWWLRIGRRSRRRPGRAAAERSDDGPVAELTRSVRRLEGESQEIRARLGDMTPAVAGIGARLAELATRQSVAALAERIARLEGAVERVPALLRRFLWAFAAIGLIALIVHMRGR